MRKKGKCKNSLFYLKNIKFLILGIDNMSAIVYYLIKIKEIRRLKNDWI